MTGTTTTTPLPGIVLTAGWNLVAVSQGFSTAQQVLDALPHQTGGSYVELDGLTDGNWSPNAFIDTKDSLGPVGDFTLRQGLGYLLYTDKAGTWPPEATG